MILALEGEAGEGVPIPHYEERIQMSLVLISDDWSVELGQTYEAARNGIHTMLYILLFLDL